MQMRKLLLGAAVLLAAPPAFAFDFCEAAAQCRAASEAQLAELRGGFDVRTRDGGQLRIDIGITRGVAVNERIVALSSAPGPLLVQVGPNNVALPGAFHAGAMPTIVQNTLDNQTLKTFTIVNASVNSLSVLNSLRVGEMMARATRASGR
jgi:hypothetical protein